MKLQTVWAVYFSGTGTTEKIVTTVASAIAERLQLPCQTLDFTPPAARERSYTFAAGDLVILGTPVIAGRVPNVLLPFLTGHVQAEHALAVPVVLYGNRNFDDALIELREILETDGFRTVAGAAFIGEHSFSRVLGAGRPDTDDLAKAAGFAGQVAEKITALETLPEAPVPVKGTLPLRPYYTPRDRNGVSINILKVKLGRDNDKEMIETIRSVTNLPIAIDANQGWKDRQYALDMIHWLKEKGIVMIEQPMPKTQIDDIAWVTEHSPLPVFADESVQRLKDVAALKGVFSGINIKLMKCTGLREAHKMMTLARALGMRVMIGCMTETSCACSAAAQLSPAVDFADLDGNLLIANDRFRGMEVVKGKITIPDLPGIGVVKL